MSAQRGRLQRMAIERSGARRKRDNRQAARRRSSTAWAGEVQVRQVGEPAPEEPPPAPVKREGWRDTGRL
jgi:hypothetical protein